MDTFETLVQQMFKRYDAATAPVLADAVEERGLKKLAHVIRSEKPSEDMRREVAELHWMVNGEASAFVFWDVGWIEPPPPWVVLLEDEGVRGVGTVRRVVEYVTAVCFVTGREHIVRACRELRPYLRVLQRVPDAGFDARIDRVLEVMGEEEEIGRDETVWPRDMRDVANASRWSHVDNDDDRPAVQNPSIPTDAEGKF